MKLGKIDTGKWNFKDVLEAVKKSAPEGLIAAAITCMGLAIWQAAKRSPKAHEEVEEKKTMYEKEGKEMPKSEVVATHAKHQIPSITLFTTASAAIIFANRVQNKRNMALALALQAGQTYSAELEDKIKKMVGIETKEKVKAEAKDDDDDSPKIIKVYDIAPNRMQMIRDEFTGCEFITTVSAVKDAVDQVNRMLVDGESVSVYVFYELLRQPMGQTEANKLIGWTANDKYGGFLLELEWYSEFDGDGSTTIFKYSTSPTTDFWG